MTAHVLQASLRALRRSWPEQLGVLGGAGVAATGAVAGLGGRGPAWLTVLAVLGVAIVALAASSVASRAGRVSARAAVRHAAHGAVQAGCATAPLLVAVLAVALAARVHPLLGLVAVPGAFVVASAVVVPALLGAGSGAHGEGSWLPRVSARALRARPLVLTGLGCVLAVACAVGALPLAVAATVAGAVVGGFGAVGVGVAAVAPLPLLGCAATGLWEVVGRALAGAPPGVPVRRGDDAVGASAAQLFAAAAAGAVPAPAATPAASSDWVQVGPWQAHLDRGGRWGTWVQVSAHVDALLVAEFNGAPPAFDACGADGVWWRPTTVLVSGVAVPVPLAPGATWLQLGATHDDAVAQPVTARLHVPGAREASDGTAPGAVP